MKKLFIDVETFSSVDIMSSGAYKYIESPDFEILIIGYAIDNSEVRIIDLASGDTISEEFEEALLDENCLKVAHNAVFERLCFKRIGYNVPINQWYCTSVKAAYCGLPLSLDNVSKVLDLKNKKLDTGKLLIKYFSCPCKPTRTNGMRTRNYPYHAPEKWELYKEYNIFDVLAEREIYYTLEKYIIPDIERKVYELDQQINDNGILIDKELVESAIAVDEKYTAILKNKVLEIAAIDNPNSPAQIKGFIKQQTGDTVDSLSKDSMQELMDKYKDKYPYIYKLLSLRKKLAKTSIKKYYAMLNCAMSDNRARGMFQFYGANRTGRWAGRLIQLQNLAKNHVDNIYIPRELVRERDIDTIEVLYEDVSDILSQLIRTAFIAPKGKTFVVADFSAIEARVISWLAEEEWRMEVFRGDGKIYEATGSKMFNVPVSAITKGSELRQKSKISELALGYGGSVGALLRMGGDKMGLSNVEMISLVRKWRKANPNIVDLWSQLNDYTIESVLTHKTIDINNKLSISTDDTNMTILLPSGRKLFYRRPILKRGSKVDKTLFYEGVSQETKQWTLIDTYGGKLTENCVQAIARDLLAYSMLVLRDNGYKIVGHIHDEVIVEVPEETSMTHYNNIIKLMSYTPDWAKDMSLRADGYVTPFYLKD